MTPERLNKLISQDELEELFEEAKGGDLSTSEKDFYARLEGDFIRNKRSLGEKLITQETFDVERQRIVRALQLRYEAESLEEPKDEPTDQNKPQPEEKSARQNSRRWLKWVIGILGGLQGIAALLYVGYFALSPLSAPPPPQQQSVFIMLMGHGANSQIHNSKVYVFLQGMGKAHRLGDDNQVQIMLPDVLKAKDSLCAYIVSEDWRISDSLWCFARLDSFQTIFVEERISKKIEERTENRPETPLETLLDPLQVYPIVLQHDAFLFEYKTVLLDGEPAIVMEHFPNFKDLEVPELNKTYSIAFVKGVDTLSCGTLTPKKKHQQIRIRCP